MIDVDAMTFGVEIEATIPCPFLLRDGSYLRVGPHGSGTDIPNLPGWKADRDPSIRPGRDRQACEFVSPIYRGKEGLRHFVIDLQYIRREMRATVNRSCGIHIHVGFDHNNRDAVAKLTTLVSNFEKAIYAATGTKNRERGRWCAGVNRYGSADAAVRNAQHCRYHVLNLASNHPTVEFRAFSASLNEKKIVGYIRLCVGLVERAVAAKRTTNWTAKPPVETSPIHRNGEGQTALTRLFYQLGWTKGRQKHTHGDLSGEGLPTLKQTKRELMRMARKYDQQT